MKRAWVELEMFNGLGDEVRNVFIYIITLRGKDLS